MTITVEDGTGKADADSYISVTDADTFHTSIGNTAWAALDTPQKEKLLRKAFYYMIGRYRSSWKGSRVYAEQSSDWPRDYVVMHDVGSGETLDNDVVPVEIGYAQALLALRANTAELSPDQSQRITSITVGPITRKFDWTSPIAVQFRQVDMMLSPYLTSTGSMVRLSRS